MGFERSNTHTIKRLLDEKFKANIIQVANEEGLDVVITGAGGYYEITEGREAGSCPKVQKGMIYVEIKTAIKPYDLKKFWSKVGI